MQKRIAAIAVIFLGASWAWMILGQTLVSRTADSDRHQLQALSAQWGSAQTQQAPRIQVYARSSASDVPLRASNVNVGINLEQRRKGLLWYNLYDVAFAGHYTVRNTTNTSHLALRMPLPASDASYTEVTYRIGGKTIDAASALHRNVIAFALEPGAETTIDVAYRSRGMDSWTYAFGNGVESVNNFSLVMNTNFDGHDFPAQTLLPTSEQRTGNGWRLQWSYGSLITADRIGVTVPYPLQPGPLAQRITFWAPVALLFYFFVMLLITTLRRIELHPVNYFFLACAFFAFHLLFAYLVDRIALEAAFAICSAVSIALTVSYLRLVVGMRFAAVESGLAHLVYLVLFSYALFNEGWSGLTITCGAIITLFVAMQLTGRVRWSSRLAEAPAAS